MRNNNPRMTEPELFILADRALNDVIQQIQDEQWAMQMPADFPTLDERTYTLRERYRVGAGQASPDSN